MARFPITAAPLPDESLDSWIEHLATLMLCSTRTLLQACDIAIGRRFSGFTTGVDDEFATKLANTTGTTPDAIHHATIYRYANLRPHTAESIGLFTGVTSKYCPRCLDESGMRWRLQWHLQTSMICRIHNCLLLERCPRCGGKPRATTARKPQVLTPGHPRQGPCGTAGCADALANASPIKVANSGQIVAAQQWLDEALKSETAEIRVLGVTEETISVLNDLQTLGTLGTLAANRTREIAIDTSKTSVTESAPSFRSNEQQVVDEIDLSSDPDPDTLGELLGQVSLISAFETTDLNDAASHLEWLPKSKAIRIIHRRPESDSKRLPISLPTRKIINHTLMTEVSEMRRSDQVTPLWYAELLRTAPVIDLPTRHLPSRAWPALVAHHPSVTEATRFSIPLTSIVSLATLGTYRGSNAMRQELRLVIPKCELDIELQSLWSEKTSRKIYKYFLLLHEHLTANPPPIDYDRRRQVFPSPSILSPGAGKYAQPVRYVWQLLTGSDPFATLGTSRQYGPLVKNYDSFVQALTRDQKHALKAEAKRILAMSGISDEPLLYTPLWNGSDFEQPSLEHLQEMDGSDVLTPGSHAAELVAGRQSRSVGSLLDCALDGNTTLVTALVHFAKTAGQHQVAAAKRHQSPLSTVSLAEDRLERFLGRTLHVRGRRGNPRALTPLGIEVRDAALTHLALLEAAANKA